MLGTCDATGSAQARIPYYFCDVISRSEGACLPNGLCEIRTRVRARVNAVARLLGSAGQLGFVVAASPGGRCFPGYAPSDGDHMRHHMRKQLHVGSLPLQKCDSYHTFEGAGLTSVIAITFLKR